MGGGQSDHQIAAAINICQDLLGGKAGIAVLQDIDGDAPRGVGVVFLVIARPVCAGQQLSLAVEDNPGGSAVSVQNSHDLAHVLQSGGILIGIGQVRDGAGNRVELGLHVALAVLILNDHSLGIRGQSQAHVILTGRDIQGAALKLQLQLLTAGVCAIDKVHIVIVDVDILVGSGIIVIELIHVHDFDDIVVGVEAQLLYSALIIDDAGVLALGGQCLDLAVEDGLELPVIGVADLLLALGARQDVGVVGNAAGGIRHGHSTDDIVVLVIDCVDLSLDNGLTGAIIVLVALDGLDRSVDFQIHILYTGVNAVYISNGNIGGIDLIHLHSDEHRVVLAVNAGTLIQDRVLHADIRSIDSHLFITITLIIFVGIESCSHGGRLQGIGAVLIHSIGVPTV